MKLNGKTKIYMIDDHQVFCNSLGLYFNLDNTFQYVGSSTSASDLFKKITDIDIDLILLDIKLGNNAMAGFEIAEQFNSIIKEEEIKREAEDKQKKRYPRIVFLSGYCNKVCQEKAKSLNLSLLSKEQRIPELITKINKILTENKLIIDPGNNETPPDPEVLKNTAILKNVLTPSEGLTALSLYGIYLERKIYATNKEISQCRGISEGGVAAQFRDIYKALKSGFEIEFIDRYKLVQLLEKSTVLDEIEKIKGQYNNAPKGLDKIAAKIFFKGNRNFLYGDED